MGTAVLLASKFSEAELPATSEQICCTPCIMKSPIGTGSSCATSPKLPSQFAPPFFLWCFLMLCGAAANATVVLDPLIEPSSTQFGYAVASRGDINGDGCLTSP